MKHLDRVRDRIDDTRAAIRRRRTGTHLLEEMPAHPEQIRDLPDPIDDGIFRDITEELLDDGLADVAEETGWTR